MERLDQRELKELRPFEVSQGLLNNADGSSKFSAGSQSVICGIYGPVEVKNKDEILDEAYIEVNYRPPVGLTGPSTKYIEKNIKSTFKNLIITTLHPRTMVQINLQPENIDGDIMSYSINATTLALIDSGLPLSTLIGSASAAIFSDGIIILDPTSEEISKAQSTHTFGFSSTSENSLIFSESFGKYSFQQYNECYDLCFEAAQKTLSFLRQSLEKKLFALS